MQVARRFAPEDWGGTETVILETCKELLRAGHSTEIFCTNATASNNGESIGGVRVMRTPYFYPYFGLSAEAKRLLDKKGGSPFSFSLMRALMRAPDVDLLHLHVGNRIGGIGRYVARRRGLPYVISLHGGHFDVPAGEAATQGSAAKGAIEWGKALGMWVGSRRVLTDAAAIICVGESERIAAQKALPEKNVIHLPNGVDPARFARGDREGFRAKYGIPIDRFVLVSIARIDSQKNQRYLVRNLPALLARNPNVHVLIIGHVTNAAYRAELQRDVEDLGVGGNVTIIDGIAAGSSELSDAYHAADVFVLPSIHEPFGIVILEAWASGLPVVAHRIGGVPYFVDDGADGVLFDLADESGFVDIVSGLAENSERRRALAEAGKRKAVGTYSWDAITGRLIGIYEAALPGTAAL